MLKLFRSTVYVRIRSEKLSVLHVESGKDMTDTPSLAIQTTTGKAVVYAVGNQAMTLFGQPNITVANGFKHPRTIIADFTIAELTLKYFFEERVTNKTFLTRSYNRHALIGSTGRRPNTNRDSRIG